MPLADEAQGAFESLLKSAMAQADPGAMMNVVASRFGVAGIPDSSALLLRIDTESTGSSEVAALFVALVDIRSMSSKLQASIPPADLRRQVVRDDPRLAEAWSRFENIPEAAAGVAIAKVSLLMEVIFLLNRELRDANLDLEKLTGADVALRVLSDSRPAGTDLIVEAGAYTPTSAGLLTEVLEELDFIQKERGIWVFRLDESSIPRLASGKNLLAYRSASSRLSPLALARSAENLVKRLGFIVRSTGMYPAGHPAIAPSVEGFLEILNQFFAGGPVVTLSGMGGDLMVNDLQVRKKGGSVEGFLRSMGERGVSSISFSAGIDAEMVLRFAGVFNRSPAYIKEHGGLGSLLERREIQGISVDQYRYALVSKDGKVMGGQGAPVEDTTLENIIFAELIDRLERGDTLRDLPDEQLGMAFKRVLQDSSVGAERQRALLSDFVATLDPGILEKGLLTRRDIQKEIAWSALRKIIRIRLEELENTDEDVRLEAMDRLLDLVVTGIERGKDNTVVQILENVSQRLLIETSPDALYTGIVLLGVALENLISRGRLSTAESAAEALERARTLDVGLPELVSARRRAFAEAIRRIDTPDVGEKLVDSLLSYNEVVARQAEALAVRIVLRNMTSRLLEVFNESDRHQRARAYRIVRRIGPKVLPVLVARLKRLQHSYETPRDPETGNLTNEDWYVSRNVIQIMGELRLGDTTDTITQLIQDPDERIREASLRALFSIDPNRAVENARTLISDSSPMVAGVAVDVIGSGSTDADATVRQLIGTFRGRPGLRLQVIRVLRRFAGVPMLSAFIREGFSSPDSIPFGDVEIATEALEILHQKPSKEDATVLRAWLEGRSVRKLLHRKGPDKQLRLNIEAALAWMESRQGG
jgi:HEAT repeat protein